MVMPAQVVMAVPVRKGLRPSWGAVLMTAMRRRLLSHGVVVD